MQRSTVHEAEAARLPADQHVGRHAHLGEQRKLLGDPGDAQLLGMPRGQRIVVDPVDFDRPRIGGDHPREHLHQRRLAGAVLTEQGEHLAGADRQLHAGKGGGEAEALGDPLQMRRHGRICGGV